jgi:hypothetical protein
VPVGPVSEEGLAAFEALIDGWAARELSSNPVVLAVDRDPDLRRWYVRMRGEEKDFTTVWLTLGQQTLQYETYFMPAPEENVESLYEYLLRLNVRLYGMRFAVGGEDAVYLVGQMPLAALDEDELDRVVGSTYAAVEQWFRPALRIGFAGRFGG